MSDRYLLQLVAIRALNDELRTRFRGGTVTVSEEVKKLGHIVVANALLTMAETDCFDNDEHQAGRFPFCARLFRWWISYGDSPNPANGRLTKRELFLSL
jgi:hypothetical protein